VLDLAKLLIGIWLTVRLIRKKPKAATVSN
jgi:hypothetical protein